MVEFEAQKAVERHGIIFVSVNSTPWTDAVHLLSAILKNEGLQLHACIAKFRFILALFDQYKLKPSKQQQQAMWRGLFFLFFLYFFCWSVVGLIFSSSGYFYGYTCVRTMQHTYLKIIATLLFSYGRRPGLCSSKKYFCPYNNTEMKPKRAPQPSKYCRWQAFDEQNDKTKCSERVKSSWNHENKQSKSLRDYRESWAFASRRHHLTSYSIDWRFFSPLNLPICATDDQRVFSRSFNHYYLLFEAGSAALSVDASDTRKKMVTRERIKSRERKNYNNYPRHTEMHFTYERIGSNAGIAFRCFVRVRTCIAFTRALPPGFVDWRAVRAAARQF